MVRNAWLMAAAALLATLGSPLPARAAKCDFTAGNISFGTYDLLSPQPTLTSGTIAVTCNPAAPSLVTVSLSAGQSGSFAARQMSAGANRLTYNVFVDSSFTTVFGDGNGGSQRLSRNVDKNNPWTIPFYARIPAGQDVAAGLYGDLLTLTVDF